MALRVCIERDCPELTRSTRCATHASAHDRDRGTPFERGYDWRHKRERARWQVRIDAGQTVRCWRCTTPITGHSWDLGHDDHDRSVTRGPECIKCNRSTATRR